MKPYYSSKAEKNASMLRNRLAVLLGVTGTGRIVLAPGVLAGLRMVAASIKADRIVLTKGEYFGASHFPDQVCTFVDESELVESVQRNRPDMVIASVVTWRGKVANVGEIFRAIRNACGKECPLLVADCSHLGAVGFPEAQHLKADIVCGDPCKWLAPYQSPVNVGFLWIGSRKWYQHLKPAFASFFLAVSDPVNGFFARWVDPVHIAQMNKWLRCRGVSRNALDRHHEKNMRLALRLATELKLETTPPSSLVWLPRRTRHPLLTTMKDRGLVWELPDGVRVMCRADLCG